MAKLPRILQKVFGRTGSTSEFGKFGSEAAGSPVTTKDLDTIQSLSQYDEGLFSATNSASEPPRIQDINGLWLLLTSQIKYLYQNGIPEWLTTENYYAGISFVVGTDGVIYQAVTGSDVSPNTGNNPVGDVVNWKTNDAVVEKARALAAESALSGNIAAETARALAAEALLAPRADPTFTGVVTVPSGSVSGAAINKSQLDAEATTARNASNLTVGTVQLARLSGITSAQMAAGYRLLMDVSSNSMSSGPITLPTPAIGQMIDYWRIANSNSFKLPASGSYFYTAYGAGGLTGYAAGGTTVLATTSGPIRITYIAA
jgi:hypothetical protein